GWSARQRSNFIPLFPPSLRAEPLGLPLLQAATSAREPEWHSQEHRREAPREARSMADVADLADRADKAHSAHIAGRAGAAGAADPAFRVPFDRAGLQRELQAVLGPERVRSYPEDLIAYENDGSVF